MSDREGTEALNKQFREQARPLFDRMRAQLNGQSASPIAGKADEMPDVSTTLGQILCARRAVQDAVGRGRLLMHMPPQVEIDHDIVIWDALLSARITITALADALDRAQKERDAGIREREETEALLCPEDVGIREYVEGLVERLGDAEVDAEFFRQVIGMSRREFAAFRDRVDAASGHDVRSPQLCRDVLMAIRQESYDASFEETTAFRRPECAHEFCGNPDDCHTACIHPAAASHPLPKGK